MNFQFAMDLVGCAFSHLPLNLATVAALTPAGMPVSIVDENVEPVNLDLEADLVGFTGIYCQRERLFELADGFRSRGRKVVIGGALATDLTEECLQHADYVLVGECEYTWPRLLAEVEDGTAQRVYRQSEPVDMADSPTPRFDLLKAERYSSGCIQATRGCPYRCEYCDVPSKDGNRPRSKPVANVLREIEALVSLGFDSVFFVDDHFAGNRKYARELLTAIAGLLARLPRPVYFYTQVTLNVARDPALLDLFRAAGFRRFFIGLETPDETTLRQINKAHNVEIEMGAAIAAIQSRGITVWAGVIVGLDRDDARSIERLGDWIDEMCFTPTLIGLLQAMPGAPLYERALAEDRLRKLPGVVGSGAMGGLASQATTNLPPAGMSTETMLRGFGQLLRRVYDPDAFARRVIAGVARGTVRQPSFVDGVHRKNLTTVARTVKFYMLEADPRSRAMFLRVLATIVRRRLNGFEELFYHLVIYKHLRQFYYQAAQVAAPIT
jgi:radical SAM superfamily enzyme YgiQ (UPF0313 family)